MTDARPLSIAIVGGGPAGLYLGILVKRRDPRHTVRIYERNQLGDTFGWGVVFSDATLGGLAEADPESFAAIQASFAYWTDIDIHYGGDVVRSTGHGFCGLSRVRLLEILHARATELGCVVETGADIPVEALEQDPRFTEADLVIAADGVNSAIRARYADAFEPSIDWRRCKFAWLGTDLHFEAFTFLFRENEHGLFQVHAYPFDATTSTFIVECREETWRAAGLDGATEEETVAYMERLFAPDLHGHRLLVNKSHWRTFPTIKCARWNHGKILLMGDAAHTAHFSIGSGTKLAMEDAIALADELDRRGDRSIPDVLAAYDEARRSDVGRLQSTAQRSLEWFENTGRYLQQHPQQFAFSLLSRSKRITWDELTLRDPAFMQATQAWWTAANGGAPGAPPMFTPFQLRGLTLPNRIVVSPMCQYSATDGVPEDWHLVHLGSRAMGGAGLVITEATAISADGRISPGCTGLWNREHVHAWRRIVDYVHRHTPAKIGVQLGHAGRKGACHVPWENGGAPLPADHAWPLVAPSAVAYDARSQVPRELDDADRARITADFVRSAGYALEAGFDLIELHFAHGYLLSTVLSALTNRREDGWGGSIEGRARWPVEIVRAVRAVWPEDRPLLVRLSTTEWADGGLTDAERVYLARALVEAGADAIDCSAGGVVPWQAPVYGRMFQVPFSDQIRHEAGVPTMAVGNIQDADQCNTILAAGRADLCVLARAHLADPYLTLHAAARYGYDAQPWPKQYLAARPRSRKGA